MTYLPTQDYLSEVSKGNISGTSHVNKFGANLTIASNTVEDVHDAGGTYSFPASASITLISQDKHQAALIGASIEVQGLDTNWDLVTQTKALHASDTTTHITLDTALRRVFRMKVLADVVGNEPIYAHDVGEANIYATILAGNNQTLMAVYTVPAGKTCYVQSYYGDMTAATNKTPLSCEFVLWAADRGNSYEFQVKMQRGVPKEAGGFIHPFSPPLVLPEKTDLKVSCLAVNDAASVHAGFDLVLVDD